MKTKIKKITVQGLQVSIMLHTENEDFISLADMLKAKDGDFFISDWLRNRNTDAVKAYLIPANISKNRINMVYANEADAIVETDKIMKEIDKV